MKAEYLNTVRILTVAGATLVSSLLGCTRETEKNSSLTLEMPASISSQTSAKAVFAQSEGAPPWDGSLNPTSLSQLTCYGIFVGGSSEDMQKSSCSSSTVAEETVMKFGRSKGFVPASSTVEIDDIPPGDVSIWIVGVVSSDGTCTEFDKMNDSVFSKTSYPHIVSEKQLTVVEGDNVVEMQAQLDTTRVFDECSFFEDGGGGGEDDVEPPVLLYGDGADGDFVFDAAIIDLDTTDFSDPDVTRTGGSRGGPSKIFSANDRMMMLDSDRTTIDISGAVNADRYEVGDEIIWHVSAGYSFSSGPDVQPPDSTPAGLQTGACGGGLFMGSYGFARITATSTANGQITVDRPIGDPDIPLSDGDNDGLPNIQKSVASGTPAGSDAQNYCSVQIRRVPQINVLQAIGAGTSEFYPSAGGSYNASSGTGGLIAIRIKRLEFNGEDMIFDTTREGFSSNTDASGGGFLGQFSINNYSSANGNGGGGTFSGTGAGGGSNAGAGGNAAGSVTSGAPAIAHCSGTCHIARDKKFFFGGAGGGMSGSAGGAGGGAVLLYVEEVDTSSGSPDGSGIQIFANGGAGTSPTGGGAGGSIHISTSKYNNANIGVEARGNLGFTGAGGGGGGAVEVNTCPGQFNPATSVINSGSIAGGNAFSGGDPGGIGDLLEEDLPSADCAP